MEDEVLIRVEGVSKKFCKDLKTSLRYGVQDLVGEVLGRPRTRELRAKEFWAINDVGFELKRGECLGLIGHNGAGKTTLLRMLNGLIKPDGGRIEIKGQVGALIALGAGFNPILTGRENIYTNAAVLGLSRKVVDARIDEIIGFAELADFIDMPVQHYSSGMTVRLGFAVAAILIEPDILFLDEVLAVGDVGFTIKCLNRVRQLMQHSAVVFVSHSMPLITSFCTRVMVMDHGRTVLDTSEPGEAVNHYYGLVPSTEQVSGNGGAVVTGISMSAGERVIGAEDTLDQGAEAEVTIALTIKEPHVGHVTVLIDDATLSPMIGVPVVDAQGDPLELGPGEHVLRVPLGRLDLNAGKYALMVAVRDAKYKSNLCRHQGLLHFRIHARRVYWAKVVRLGASERLPLSAGPRPKGDAQPFQTDGRN